MAVTYNAPSNKITVTGYSLVTPANFTDIYNADVAGGWGVVSKQGNNQFLFACHLQIGTYSSVAWFADTLKQIEFELGYTLVIAESSRFRLGAVDNSALFTGKNGCNLILQPSSLYQRVLFQPDGSEFELYNSQIILKSATNRWGYYDFTSTNWGGLKFRLWGSQLVGGYYIYLRGVYPAGECGVFQTDFENLEYGLYFNADLPDSFFKESRMLNSTYGFYFFMGSGFTVNNLKFLDVSASMYFFGSSGNYNLIDCEISNWAFANMGNAIVNRQYTFNLKVTDKDANNINGATVKIWDKDDTLVVDTTTASGVITKQTITRGYYDNAHGNTLQDASPHTIEISKAGYQTIKHKFTMDKIDWVKRLKRIAINADSESIL